MSAETLREAAKLLRERAEAATPGPWRADEQPGTCFEIVADRDIEEQVVYNVRQPDAAYIANVAPPFTALVAAWLDATATRVEEIHESLPFTVRLTANSLNVTAADEALAVAEAVLA